MRVIRLHSRGELLLHNEPMPVEAESLMQVKAVGVCGSDITRSTEGEIGDAKLEHPLVLGHELTAITSTGERVVADPAIACGQCEFCQKGHANLCQHVKFAGHGTQDGALCEWMTWLQNCVYSLPDALSYEGGATLAPPVVALHAIDLGKLRAGMNVGILTSDRISFQESGARRIGLTINLVRRMKHVYLRAMELVLKGLIDVRSIVMHSFHSTRLEEAYRVA